MSDTCGIIIMALVKAQGTYSTIVINEWKKIILVACINTAYINQQSKSDSSEMVLLLYLLCVCVCVFNMCLRQKNHIR